MKAKHLLALVTGVAVLCACHTTPTPPPNPPTPDASDAQPPTPLTPTSCSDASTDCINACNTLLRLGCSEGAGMCPCTMQKVNDDQLVRDRVSGFTVTCASVATWKTRDDVVAHTNWLCSPL